MIQAKRLIDVGLTEEVAISNLSVEVKHHIQPTDTTTVVCNIKVNGDDNLICCDTVVGGASADEYAKTDDLGSIFPKVGLEQFADLDEVKNQLKDWTDENGVKLSVVQNTLSALQLSVESGLTPHWHKDQIDLDLVDMYKDDYVLRSEVDCLSSQFPCGGISEELNELTVGYYSQTDAKNVYDNVVLSSDRIKQQLSDCMDDLELKATTSDVSSYASKDKYDALCNLAEDLERKVAERVPLTFIAAEPNCSVTLSVGDGNPDPINLQTSFDGVEWTDYTVNTKMVLSSQGLSVMFRSNPTTGTGKFSNEGNYYRFQESAGVSCIGNVMSLVDSTMTSKTVNNDNQFCYLFEGSTSLITAPKLPATTLAESCYTGMFYNCTSLIEAPNLPATALASLCYDSMFEGCNIRNHTISCHMPTSISGTYDPEVHGDVCIPIIYDL